MAEISNRELCARTIRNCEAFATSDNFNTRLIREVRTRLDHLCDAWSRLRGVHAEIVSHCDDEAQRELHDKYFDNIETIFLATQAILIERLYNNDHPSQYDDETIEDVQTEHEQENDQHSEHSVTDEPPPNRSPPSNQRVSQGGSQANATVPPTNYVGPPIIVQCGNKKVDKTWSDFDGTKTQWQGFHDLFKSCFGNLIVCQSLLMQMLQ